MNMQSVQEDQAQDEDTGEGGQRLQYADQRDRLIRSRCLHLGGAGGNPEEIVVAVEHHHAAGSTCQHGDDAAHRGGKPQNVQQRDNHRGSGHHGNGSRTYAGAEQETDQERCQNADGQAGESIGQDILQRRGLPYAGERAAGADNQDDLACVRSASAKTPSKPHAVLSFGKIW